MGSIRITIPVTPTASRHRREHLGVNLPAEYNHSAPYHCIEIIFNTAQYQTEKNRLQDK
jgi:hypothetical protein